VTDLAEPGTAPPRGVLEPGGFPGPLRRLRRWHEDGGRCRVGIMGAGFVGAGLAQRMIGIPGVELSVVVSRHPARAGDALRRVGVPGSQLVVASSPAEVRRAAADGRTALTADPSALVGGSTDLVMEATGSLDPAASVMFDAVDAGLPVVSMNAEVDATIGWLLHERARAVGSVYTIADGDQPGVLLRLIGSVVDMGFRVTAALNCKRHLDVHQSPGGSGGYAGRDGTSLHMTTAFGDGTKMNVENVVVANLTGLGLLRRGMVGVRTTLQDAAERVPAELGTEGMVDYTLGGDFGAGVAVIARSPHPNVDTAYLRYFKMGDGPHHLFFRPYHLVHMEIAATLADVLVDRVPLAAMHSPPSAEVVAVAKRDLSPGDRLDGIGGAACYGQADLVGRARGYLPMGLSHAATVISAVARDEPVPIEAVHIDHRCAVVGFRAVQDRAVQDRAVQDRAVQDRAVQDRALHGSATIGESSGMSGGDAMAQG
jgi:predicted homoserine dehydrogenase-like protein